MAIRHDRTDPQRRFALRGLAAVGALAANPASGQLAAPEWPTRPVRVIVPFGPGSTPDVFARLISERLSPVLRQPVVVENRVGAAHDLSQPDPLIRQGISLA
jgi:tripartite-type tricarboxylate transporter receptor subunit TctC